ncbi:MAG: LacI family DNA-binding transcriptional regulator [Lentisphaeria bacterium]
MGKAAKVTLNDVARRAKVSIGTASRVLNGHPRVSKQAHGAVQEAILELGYRPDSVARSLRRNQPSAREGIWSGNIGFVLPNTESSMLELPFVTSMVNAIQTAVSENGHHLMIANTLDPESLPRLLLDRKVEGVILFGTIAPALGAQISALAPTVVIGSCPGGPSLSTVNVDNRQAILAAMHKLHALGHRKIGFVNREPTHADFAERLLAYREGQQQLGLDQEARFEAVRDLVGDEKRVRRAEPKPPVMDELLEPLFRGPDAPTALLVANDWQAIGVYQYLTRRGLRIGRDVSVIGFDNDIRICESLAPSLTSLQYPSMTMGRNAVNLLLSLLQNKGESSSHAIRCASTLVERDSCSAAATPKPPTPRRSRT